MARFLSWKFILIAIAPIASKLVLNTGDALMFIFEPELDFLNPIIRFIALSLLVLASCYVFVFLFRRRFIECGLLVVIICLVILTPRLTFGSRFLLNKKLYLEKIAADPSPSPKFLFLKWHRLLDFPLEERIFM